MSEIEPMINEVEKSPQEKARIILNLLPQLIEPQGETKEKRTENFKKLYKLSKKITMTTFRYFLEKMLKRKTDLTLTLVSKMN